ncbi:beta-monoglucosyldiacylglycerol synthase [Oxobacter pfennigii]|uniref:Beta-monoglucosyldiacylglycerol synthase n=1 Tax=Oxobacter pfennigii TaxID=36849 RepID=A0A0P8WC83_9CLOT|nr:glycosyltransferase family 2 protein [Oxobacter pfennigii]KPU45339.1 beta-monoglucosyldiacylglycerol synthase [Oxobacter pfennigii]
MKYVFYLTALIQIPVFFITLYYIIISIFGIYKGKRHKEFEPQKKFAIIVAAHNEEMVIGHIIDSLMDLDYPHNMYDVFVIADNCTDKTAKIADIHGAYVFERQNDKQRGKGYALEWMFQNIFSMKKKYDCIAVFDADNLVSKNFLREMNNKLCEGYKVVQGFLDSKNPNDSWITASYSIAFWSSNRMFQLAKSNLGLSSQIGGTGFCVDVELLKQLGWGATCLTEDLEFSCKLILNGEKIGWAHDAVIYDEKPLTLKQSWKQRKRWMQGFADVSGRFFFKLLIKGIKDFDITALDCALYTIQPYILIVFGVSTILTFTQSSLNIPLNVFLIKFLLSSALGIGDEMWNIIMIIQFFYTPALLLLDRKLDLRISLWYIIYPLYVLTWIPIALSGIMNKNNKEWTHTIHTRQISIEDIENSCENGKESLA